MSIITDAKDQINDLMTFKHISAAFTEAAAVKLKNIRDAFNRNSDYYEEISHIYHLVEMNAKRMETVDINGTNSQNFPALNILSKSKKTVNNSLPRKGARLYIALTSNQRFFGSINSEIMNTFLRDAKDAAIEKMIVGVTGETYLRSVQVSFPYKKMSFKNELPDEEETRQFFQTTENYDQVRIYFPKFISFLKQEVGASDITQKIALSSPKTRQSGKDYQWQDENIQLIFEPEISKMIKFFDNQVRRLLFKRVLLETEMARTAARLLAMSQAEERTDAEIKKKKAELRKATRSFTNAQLLDTFAGIKRWKH